MNIEREELYGYLGFQSSTCHYGDKFRQKLIIKKSVSATTADGNSSKTIRSND